MAGAPLHARERYELLGRLSWQSMGILVGLNQVLVQLGPVLELEIPSALKHVMDVLSLDVPAMLAMECFGFEGADRFWMGWWLRIVGARPLSRRRPALCRAPCQSVAPDQHRPRTLHAGSHCCAGCFLV